MLTASRVEEIVRERLKLHGDLLKAVAESRRIIVELSADRLPLTPGHRQAITPVLKKIVALWASVWAPGHGKNSAEYPYMGAKAKDILRRLHTQYEIILGIRQAMPSLPGLTDSEGESYDEALGSLTAGLDREVQQIQRGIRSGGVVAYGRSFRIINERCELFLKLTLGGQAYREFDRQYSLCLNVLNRFVMYADTVRQKEPC